MQAREAKIQPTYRKDYRAPDYGIEAVELDFDLREGEAFVEATLAVRRRAGVGDVPLVLQGEGLETLEVAIDGRVLDAEAYRIDGETLEIAGVPARFELKTRVRIKPDANKTMSGLYRSSGNFCTQCEAEGFRRITWFLDRPDVMARYRVRIEADEASCPVLLSNGNRIDAGKASGGRHWVRWEDPFAKPCYLFALVAGTLSCHAGSYRTMSGREVRLEIWVEPQNIDKCEHALESLKRAFAWDERCFGLEYDLDLYMIVAVGDFNMGAMENKGLNIFNSKFVLAKPSTATDEEYDGIESVIAHEYFHNWTGNRVTCRDWFQLTLKEGLTVFRDQQFSMDLWSAAVKRIEHVRNLRASQFAEDAGPMAHPIRPEFYVKMDNFYTATVYVKGAEVVRMYQTLLGREGFRKGMDLYFARHDGEAVTCDDFRSAMADANGRDFTQFERWYSQAGAPTVKASASYDATARRYSLRLEQSFPKIAKLPDPAPTLIPVTTALLASDGRRCGFTFEGERRDEVVLELCEAVQTFHFDDVDEAPTPSLLRGFSAPVKLEFARSRDEVAFLAAHDDDAFNRWEAGQTLATEVLLEVAAALQRSETPVVDERLLDAFTGTLRDPQLDGSMKDLALTLPAERYLIQQMQPWDPDAIGRARDFVEACIAEHLRDAFLDIQRAHVARPYRFVAEDVDRRALLRRALSYLAVLEDDDECRDLVEKRFHEAQNMTEEWAAFRCLAGVRDAGRREAAVARFYERWKGDALVVDKWFQAQASIAIGDDVARMRRLCEHPDFKIENPNRARSVLMMFGVANLRGFHQKDGTGYDFLADKVIDIDAFNPQLASRIVSSFNHWARFDEERRAGQRRALERIAAKAGLSKDVGEIVERALA